MASTSKSNPKGDLLSDLAGQLLSNSGLNLDSLVEAAGDKLPGLLQKKSTYPMITVANWKKLCTKFQRSVPVNINKKWVADSLEITQSNAEKSVLPDLVLMGLVNTKGKSTDRAKALGSESSFRRACSNILKDVYPDELTAIDSSTKTGQTKIQAWFKKNTSESEANAKRMASIYIQLVNDSQESISMATSSKSAKDKKPTASKSSDSTVSISVKLDFPNASQAQKFDDILTSLAEQVHAKVEKLS